MSIKTLSFGCRLNALESEKIQSMLKNVLETAIVVNTCAVTGEAERQSGQSVRRIARENKNTPIFVTGCAATRNPEMFCDIPNVIVVDNFQKRDINAYMDAMARTPCNIVGGATIDNFRDTDEKLSKKFVQIQNGCNHDCTYCVTRLLRGRAVSFEYDEILADVRAAVDAGFGEIVLTGVDIASYARVYDGRAFLISDLCKKLLVDVPGIQRLRLSSMDPAVPEVGKIIDLIKSDARMMPHMHFSMQSGSDTILKSMRRRHTADTVRKWVQMAGDNITFSWDIICGFPGESEELFNETLALVRELKPIKIHAFPFSPRPDTVAATMPNQVNRAISKQRVKIINDAANENRANFMQSQLRQIVQVLVEENNIARCPHDISVKIVGTPIPPRTICNTVITEIQGDAFVGKIQ
ncbi:MAG: MiaB/RimO family radical SAM methylthiotransferase [Alphaproteobacteria bacterium]|nr:MiaB/RimO family radical SAM methylthiotransferase [Alphaproteobacteria bacterium]MBQ7127559.1 MiaB/RimO family radical SAM methylthiotransferase [Alphaproteobacteria bacterium]